MYIDYRINNKNHIVKLTLCDIDIKDVSSDGGLTIKIPNEISDKQIEGFGATLASSYSICATTLCIAKMASFNVKYFNIVLPNTINFIDLVSIDEKISSTLTAKEGLSIPIKINIPKSVSYIKDMAFSFSHFKEILFDKNYSLTEIPKNCFRSCVFEEKFTFPKSVKKINNQAFMNARFKKGIDFENSNIETIGIQSFCCAVFNEENIRFPKTLQEIEGYAFSETKNLKSIETSKESNFQLIGFSAFRRCVDLETIILRSCAFKTILKENVFYDCFNLKRIDFSEINSDIIPSRAFSNSFKKKNYIEELKLPKGITSLGSYCFKGSPIESLEIPETVFSIGDSAFEDAKLKNIIFGKIDNLRKIGASAFRNCCLKEIPSNIFENIKECGDNAFSNNEFEELHLNAPYSLEIKSEFGIPSMAIFSDNLLLKKITLTNNLAMWKIIPMMMFAGCENLESVIIPDSVFRIKDGAFKNTAIKSICLAVDELGESVFENCRQLEVCDLSKSNISEIKTGTFKKATSLKKVILPTFSKTTVYKSAFFRYQEPRILSIFQNSPFINIK